MKIRKIFLELWWIALTLLSVFIVNGCASLGSSSQSSNPEILSVEYFADTGGTINGETSQTVEYGASAQSVVAVPNEGYEFIGWSDGVQTAIRNDNNVVEDISATALFAKKVFTVHYQSSTGGTINGEISQTVEYGASAQSVVAIPNEGYEFIGWSDGVQTAIRNDNNVVGNISATALFAKKVFTVEYRSSTGGTINGAISQTVEYGTSAQSVVAVPNEGYEFIGWSDGVQTAMRNDSNVVWIISATALFTKKTFTVHYQSSTGGTINGAISQTVEYGASAQSVVAVPNEGYEFTGWSDGVLDAHRTDDNVIANLSVVANFNFLFNDGDGSTNDPFTITTYSHLLDMRFYPSAIYQLGCDIDMDGIIHEPLFDETTPFDGIFYGNNHTIKNLRVKSDKNFPSLFGFIRNGIVSSVNLTNVQIIAVDYNTQGNNNYCVGTVAGVSAGVLRNITVDGSIVSDKISYDCVTFGGLVGMGYSSIENCSTNVQIKIEKIERTNNTGVSYPFVFGGLVGVGDGTHIRNSTATGKIEITQSVDTVVGGFVGYYFTDSMQTKEIIGCQSNVIIKDMTSDLAGGFIGCLSLGENTALTIQDCLAKVDITANTCAGFLCHGVSTKTAQLMVCDITVNGKVEGMRRGSGFLSDFHGDSGNNVFQNCKVQAVVRATENNDNGYVIGFAYQISSSTLFQCSFEGELHGYMCYGFIFMLTSNTKATYCFAEISIFDCTYHGSAFSYAVHRSEVKNCYTVINVMTNEVNNFFIIGGITESSISNFYYCGTWWTEAILRILDSAILDNIHILKSDSETAILYSEEDTEKIIDEADIILYDAKADMYYLADILNKNNENIWVDVENSTPKLNFSV